MQPPASGHLPLADTSTRSWRCPLMGGSTVVCLFIEGSRQHGHCACWQLPQDPLPWISGRTGEQRLWDGMVQGGCYNSKWAKWPNCPMESFVLYSVSSENDKGKLPGDTTNTFTPKFKKYILPTFWRETYKWGSEKLLYDLLLVLLINSCSLCVLANPLPLISWPFLHPSPTFLNFELCVLSCCAFMALTL